MRHWAQIVGIAALSLAASSIAACGGSGGGGSSQTSGAGAISITSFSPNPILGCVPTAFTITGTNFQDVSGSTAIVKFTATSGAPFDGSAVATVIGTVTGPTTITGTSPAAVLCGIAPVTVNVDVTLESGVSTSTTGTGTTITIAPPGGGAGITFLPNPVPAAIPTAFTITGTGFTPGPVTIRFVSANPGDLNFDDGVSNSYDIAATATSSTTITGETPVARACTANFTSSVQVLSDDGCCTAPTASTFLTWLAPTITTGGVGTFGIIPSSMIVTGTNLGVSGEIGTVRLLSPALPIFNNGASNSVDIPGTVGGGGTSFTFLSPVIALCPFASFSASMRWIAPRGSSCANSPANPAAITWFAPTITATTPTPLTVPALAPTPFALAISTTLPVVGTPVTLRFTSTSAGTPAIFNDGTATSIDLAGAVTGTFDIAGTTPAARLCGIDTATASITILYPGGSCTVSSPTLVTFEAPSLTAVAPGGIQNANVPTSLFPDNNLFSLAGGDPFILTALPGRSFGTVGSFVEVRFTTAGAPIWQGGAQDFDTVVGQVTSSTTIAGAAPPTTLVTTADPQTATVQVFFEDGACSSTTTAIIDGTTDRTFVISPGSVITVDQGGFGAPALIGAPSPTGSDGGVAVDSRTNRLATAGMTIFDTAPTMIATPAGPSPFASPEASAGGLITVAPDLHAFILHSAPAGSRIDVIDQNATSGLGVKSFFAPIIGPGRLFYNAPAREAVVALGTTTIALFDPQSGNYDALFAIPPIVVTGTATWNGVIAMRPGAASGRAYMVYDDPTDTNDAIGTLQLSTGVITTVTMPVGAWVTAASPNALGFDTALDQVVWWHATQAAVNLERRNPSTLAPVLAVATAGGSNFQQTITVDPNDHRYYATDTGNAVLVAINGASLASVGTVAVATPGANASTSP